MHVFTYSERPGTNAAKLDGKVDNREKRERSRILHELSDKKKRKFYESNIGSKRNVLFESDNSGGFMHGFTGNYLKVKTRYDGKLVNQIIEVELDVLDDKGVFHYKP
jgi:threonylcarbamoyladenosine tRNA methylthiotransferase MtaB